MQEYVGALIAAARRRLKQAVMARVSERHLNPQQFWILVGLAEHPGAAQCALAERICADAPTISRALGALIERHLVRTDLDPDDRRRSRVFLTNAGERLAAELLPLAKEIRDAVVDGMTPAEQAALTRGLHRVIANLGRLEIGTEEPGTSRERA